MARLAFRSAVVAIVSGLAVALAAAPAYPSHRTATNYEFDGTAALPDGWGYATATGCTDPSNVSQSDGMVTLRVGAVGTHPYCGARIQSLGTFVPPFTIDVGARYQLPAGVHTGPTMYGADGDPWPLNGEADLGEMTAQNPTAYHVRLWTQKAAATTPTRCGDQFDLQSALDPTQWHDYGVAFTTSSATFLLDGVPMHTVTARQLAKKGCTWPYNQTAGLRIFLTAASGGIGGTPQPTGYPALEQFDYVRVTSS